MGGNRPGLVVAAGVIVGIPSGIAVLTGAYMLVRPPSGVPLAMIGLSFAVGLVLILGLNAMWERKYGGWPFGVVAMAFGLVASILSQVVLWPDRPSVAIGVSWVVTAVSAIGLAILFVPNVRDHYRRSAA